MICTSIQNKELPEILQLLRQLEMAEIRLDRCALEDEDIDILFSESDVPLIATCRMQEEPQAPELLERAIEAGAKYVDLEMEAPAAVGRRIREACRRCGTVLIRSFHNFESTPSLPILRSQMERARSFGADIVKIATTAICKADLDAVAALYDEADAGSLVAFCMGEIGQPSRVGALEKGAPFTYACLDGEPVAPGQMETQAMRRRVYGNFRFVHSAAPIPMPSSKSFAQRAVIAAALASGTSVLDGYSPCGDSEAALSLAQSLGAQVERIDRKLIIKGIGASKGCLEINEINAGESGFLSRLMIPLMAVLSEKPVRINGEKSLLKRPLSQAHDIMAAYGVRLYPEKPAPRSGDCMIPLSVAGPIIPGRADVSGKGGSQLISGLLSALPLAGGRSELYVHDPRSIPYLFITVDILKHFGIKIGSEMEGDQDFLETQDWSLCTGLNFRIKGGQSYQSASFGLEGDWSGAAPFLCAGAIFGQVEVEGLDTRSLQADISIMDILVEAGASMSQADGPCSSIRVQRAPLNAFGVDLNNCPDLFPAVAVLAAFCPGQSCLKGVERLRHKETDRAAAIEAILSRMGVEIEIEEDEMRITGIGLSQRIICGKLLRGGHYSSYGDHRIAMALRLASLGADSPVTIDDEACLAKSYPGFNKQFESL